MILHDVGIDGQQLLKSAKIVIIGSGALGCPVALYLACAGVQHLKIIDDDVVELSNLHRQVVHTMEKLGQPKVISLKEQLLLRNPTIYVEGIEKRVVPENVIELVESSNIIVDCSDNASTRYLLNDIAVLLHKVNNLF